MLHSSPHNAAVIILGRENVFVFDRKQFFFTLLVGQCNALRKCFLSSWHNKKNSKKCKKRRWTYRRHGYKVLRKEEDHRTNIYGVWLVSWLPWKKRYSHTFNIFMVFQHLELDILSANSELIKFHAQKFLLNSILSVKSKKIVRCGIKSCRE